MPNKDRAHNARRAFERRFGKSMLPLAALYFRHDNGGNCIRVTDRETGSWAEYNMSGWRIVRMREHDAEEFDVDQRIAEGERAELASAIAASEAGKYGTGV